MKLSSRILERQAHVGEKRNRNKNSIKTGFQSIIGFDCRFFDLDFSLQVFGPDLPAKSFVIKIILA